MSLGSCPKCWDNPCVCGHEYTRMSPLQRKQIACAALGVSMSDIEKAFKVTLQVMKDKYTDAKRAEHEESLKPVNLSDFSCRFTIREEDLKMDDLHIPLPPPVDLVKAGVVVGELDVDYSGCNLERLDK